MTFETIPCRGAGRDEAPPCACCGAYYPRRRVAIRFVEAGIAPRDLCPECVLRGPAGAGGEIRRRIAAGDPAAGPAGGRLPAGAPGDADWAAVLERRARAFEALESFPLAVRRAAVRETRERR